VPESLLKGGPPAPFRGDLRHLSGETSGTLWGRPPAPYGGDLRQRVKSSLRPLGKVILQKKIKKTTERRAGEKTPFYNFFSFLLFLQSYAPDRTVKLVKIPRRAEGWTVRGGTRGSGKSC